MPGERDKASEAEKIAIERIGGNDIEVTHTRLRSDEDGRYIFAVFYRYTGKKTQLPRPYHVVSVSKDAGKATVLRV